MNYYALENEVDFNNGELNLKRLTPTKAIKEHCRWFCMNSKRINCISKECVLKIEIPALKKIKAFCKECAPDFRPEECDGIVLNTDKQDCPLHPFRFGKNPFIKHGKYPAHLKQYMGDVSHLQKFHSNRRDDAQTSLKSKKGR